MKCPDCEGKGFKEYDAGLVRIGCKTCEGTGKVDCELTKEEFEKAYAFRSDMTPDQVAVLGLVAVPSDCTEGWAMQKAEITGDSLEDEPDTNTDGSDQQRLDNIEAAKKVIETKEKEAAAEQLRATRVLKPNEYRCSKCSKPGKTVIHMVKKDGKGVGTKHLEFKV